MLQIHVCCTLVFLYSFSSLFAQIPPNDVCAQALEIEPGMVLSQENNAQATTTHTETPEATPASCIETFENDLWYKFTAQEGHRLYEVIIDPLGCNTPAGMQAMIIESVDCEAENFIYRACANPRQGAKLKLFLEEPEAGKTYLIYADGFDGTECVYSLELKAHRTAQPNPDDTKFLQNDYRKVVEPDFFPDNYELAFMNNEATIQWSANVETDVEWFLVERMSNVNTNSPFGKVISRIKPAHAVGAEESQLYSYTDSKAFFNGAKYCYRIVKIHTSGAKSYAESLCSEARIIESFHISEVVPAPGKGIYQTVLKSHKRQSLTFKIFDREMTILKEMSKKYSGKDEGLFTIDMNAYPPGTYFLRVENKDEFFLRKFAVE